VRRLPPLRIDVPSARREQPSPVAPETQPSVCCANGATCSRHATLSRRRPCERPLRRRAITGDGWLIDETRPLTEADLDDLDRELADAGPDARSAQLVPTLAVSLHDVVIHDTRKWFGEADIRIDTFAVTGFVEDADPRSVYTPKTQTFPRVRDGDRLPIGEGGLLLFHGSALHFVDAMILVSRDRKDTDDLATLLATGSTMRQPGRTRLRRMPSPDASRTS
jgi:hypothetical protein